ncbi:MAG: GAF and ANTAR domain-containing protein [Egibacteraceae bacterium]
MRELEMFEATTGEGPCAEAYRRCEAVEVDDLDREATRWPRLVAKANALGYRSVYARPLRLRSTCIGALNLFRDEAGPFAETQRLAATGLADIASIGILYQRTLNAADVEIAQLRHALESRKLIEQAKGALANLHDVPPDQAFDWLRRFARTKNAKLHEVARQIVQGELSPDDVGPV